MEDRKHPPKPWVLLVTEDAVSQQEVMFFMGKTPAVHHRYQMISARVPSRVASLSLQSPPG